jgi:cell division protein FtsA
VIADGRFLFTDVLPAGGAHLTYDLARVLSTSLAESERIKTLYGTVVAARSDERDVVSYARAGERDTDQAQTTKLELRRILYPRVVEQMRLLRERIETSDISRFVEGGVVLTGGGAQLVGLPDVAGEILERPVRFGHTRISEGMPEALESPAFAAAAGMIEAAGSQQDMSTSRRRNEAIAGNSYLVRMTDWVRENF